MVLIWGDFATWGYWQYLEVGCGDIVGRDQGCCKQPTTHRTVSPQHRIIQSKMSIVKTLGNPLVGSKHSEIQAFTSCQKSFLQLCFPGWAFLGQVSPDGTKK